MLGSVLETHLRGTPHVGAFPKLLAQDEHDGSRLFQSPMHVRPILALHGNSLISSAQTLAAPPILAASMFPAK